MSDVVVPGMSRLAVFNASRVVRALVPDSQAYLNVLHLAENILPKHLDEYIFSVVDDEELGYGQEGETTRGYPHIAIARSVYDGAYDGNARDRYTIAHELGHLILHSHLGLARAKRPAEGQKVRPFESAEWQAETFGGALLMPIDHFRGCRNDEEVQLMFGVSAKAAQAQRRAYQKEGWI